MTIKENRNGVGNPAIEHESCVRVIDDKIVVS
jgi:IMP cyclohydrolase